MIGAVPGTGHARGLRLGGSRDPPAAFERSGCALVWNRKEYGLINATCGLGGPHYARKVRARVIHFESSHGSAYLSDVAYVAGQLEERSELGGDAFLGLEDGVEVVLFEQFRIAAFQHLAVVSALDQGAMKCKHAPKFR